LGINGDGSGNVDFFVGYLLGVIGLFISTKDRWNWRKIIFRLVLVIAGLLIFLGFGFYVYQSLSDRPEPQTSFWDVSLDSTKGDIKFFKGPPIKGPDATNWFYSNKPSSNTGEDSIIHIGFKNDKIHFVA